MKLECPFCLSKELHRYGNENQYECFGCGAGFYTDMFFVYGFEEFHTYRFSGLFKLCDHDTDFGLSNWFWKMNWTDPIEEWELTKLRNAINC